MPDLRALIQQQVYALVGFGTGEVVLDRPVGDPGLFGPGSAAWRVHGDFTAMMIGGVAALLMQMLHPGALAGVWDHSNFRKDMAGRLRRTAQFISATTYGPTAQAEALIARVRAIHDRVHGTLPNGTAYSANDPDLLTWVHVAEVSCFLRAHLRYRDPSFPTADQDRYYGEVATIARRLGAADVPADRLAVERYLREMRPRLRVDTRTREVAAALLGQPSPSLALTPFRDLMLRAGVELLPDWARAMHGLPMPALGRPAIRIGASGVGNVLRWALRGGSAARARAALSRSGPTAAASN